jgi:UDP-3-O-[3-hydroxymyristoyl] N-acetylglucosamine deacetylase
VKSTQRKQRTLKKSVSFSGIGIHTGAVVKMSFVPAPVGTGVVFKRIDLPDKPAISAKLSHVCDTSRSTTIGSGKMFIHTIEHVMAALRAMGVDNLFIELSNVEPPVGNGSSDVFVEMIESGELVEQSEWQPVFQVKDPIYYSDGEISIIALPHDGYRISYTLNYPTSPILKCQFFSADITPSVFKKEIAPCRTFALYEEITALKAAGLIKGGSLDNAVIIQDETIFSKEGLFFPDEMVRHKILDMIGDIGLVACDIQAHIIAIRAGHASNYAFAKKLWSSMHG